MKLKKFIAIMVACALPFTLAACGGSGTSDNTPSSSSSSSSSSSTGETTTGDKVSVTVAIYSDPFEVDIVTKHADAYMAENQDVEVIIEPVAGDIWEVLKTRMAADSEPDIFYMDIFQSAQFIDAGKLAPLNDVLSDDDYNDFEPALLNGFTHDDTLYGIPKDFSTLALYYNKDIFDAAGLSAPTTWEELNETATTLSTDGQVGLIIQNELPRMQPFFYSNGGGMVKDGVPTLNTPENVEAYKFVVDMINSGAAQTPQQMGVGWSGDGFASGQAAMAVEGTWMVNSLLELSPDLNYGVVEIPVKNNSASMQFTVAYSMSNNTEHPEVAKDVISFLTSYDQQLEVANAGRSMPSRLSALETYKSNWPERSIFADVASVASEFNYGIISPTVVTETANAMEKVLLTGADVEEAFAEAQEKIDTALSQYN